MNKFDQLSGLSDYDESLGFLKKIKKKAKKALKAAKKPVRAVVKAHKKAFNTIVKKPIQAGVKAASPLLANPVIKAAVIGGATAIGATPLAIAGVNAAANMAKSNEAGKAAKKATKRAGYAPLQSAINEVSDNEYVNAVQQMRNDGMTDAQIEREWIQSDTYKQAAVPAVADMLTPHYQAHYKAAGVQNFAEVGETVAARDAIHAVNEVQKSFSLEKMIIPAAIGVAALLILKK